MIADPTPAPAGADATAWRIFAHAAVLVAAALGALALTFVAVVDPYGLRSAPGRPPGPIVDANQRLSYPQIARGGPFDAAVFGTSTARLLDPAALGVAFGARFANLAVNAATPDEQMRLAALFLARRPVRAVLFALDATWCAADPPARTGNAFPDWLYAPGAPWGPLHQFGLRGVSVAARAVLARLGLERPRIRADGYAVFTPPEALYDPARARAHIRAGSADPEAPADAPAAPMPALDMLERALAEMPAGARTLIAFMPVHAAAQGRPGTAAGLREAACKARVAQIARRHGAVAVDFRLASPVTTRDENYWDALHYRLPVARRIVAGLEAAADTGRDAADGFYQVLAHQ